MSFSYNKLVDLNVFFYIQSQVLYSEDSNMPSFDEQVEDDELQRVDVVEMGIKDTDNRAFKATNANWVYFVDAYTVTIKKNGFDIDPNDYSINYRLGMIIFTKAYAGTLDTTDLITADYYYLTVGVIDGYPYDLLNNSNAEDEQLPVVAVEYLDGVPVPYELGGTRQKVRSFSIHILGASDSERDDLAGLIANSLEYSVPVTDYRGGMPLNFDGTKNSSFTPTVIDNVGRIEFDNVKDRVNRVKNPTYAQRHWSIVTFITRSFI